MRNGRRFIRCLSAKQFFIARLHLDRSRAIARSRGPIEIEGHRLSLLQSLKRLADHNAGMEKNIPAAIARLDEADSFFGNDLADGSDQHLPSVPLPASEYQPSSRLFLKHGVLTEA